MPTRKPHESPTSPAATDLPFPERPCQGSCNQTKALLSSAGCLCTPRLLFNLYLSLGCDSRYLKPDVDKKSKHKTAVKKKTLNPEFNEVRGPTVALRCASSRMEDLEEVGFPRVTAGAGGGRRGCRAADHTQPWGSSEVPQATVL